MRPLCKKPYEQVGNTSTYSRTSATNLGVASGGQPLGVYGAPALVHPRSGSAFRFAGGTHTYALRLPLDRRQAAIADGGVTKHEYPAYQRSASKPQE